MMEEVTQSDDDSELLLKEASRLNVHLQSSKCIFQEHIGNKGRKCGLEDKTFFSKNNRSQKEVKILSISSERTVVLDAGAFIRLKRLERYGDKFFVPPTVANEIRDTYARSHLYTLLQIPNVLNPGEADIKWAKHFAKLTGDIGFLSPADIEVIALTYMLQRNSGDVSMLRTSPLQCKVVRSQFLMPWGPSKGKRFCERVSTSIQRDKKSYSEGLSDTEIYSETRRNMCFNEKKECNDNQTSRLYDSMHATVCTNEATFGMSRILNSSGITIENEETLEVDEDDTHGEWIKDEESLIRFNHDEDISEQTPKVACMTSDYSIQNVLIQMGLNILSFDGYRIKNVKMWGILCRACNNFSQDTTRIFCQKCGNNTVDRVPVNVDAQTNELIIHDNRKCTNKRGTIYSIPKPKSGRHQKDLIFAEDQLMMNGREKEFRHQFHLWKKDTAQKNPFDMENGDISRVWCSRMHTASGKVLVKGAPKISVGLGPGNPNSNRWRKRQGKK